MLKYNINDIVLVKYDNNIIREHLIIGKDSERYICLFVLNYLYSNIQKLNVD